MMKTSYTKELRNNLLMAKNGKTQPKTEPYFSVPNKQNGRLLFFLWLPFPLRLYKLQTLYFCHTYIIVIHTEKSHEYTFDDKKHIY